MEIKMPNKRHPSILFKPNIDLQYKKNTLYTCLLKILSVVTSFIIVPITIDFVNAENYGIWLTLSSMVTWISFFDLGLTNGLRNKLTEAISLQKYKLAKTYISTSYALLFGIFFILWLIITLTMPYLNWVEILKVSTTNAPNISQAFIIIFSYFCLSFVLKIINIVLFADQRAAMASLIDVSGQVVALIVIYSLTLVTKGSLLLLCICLCMTPLIVTILFSIFLYRGKYKKLSPSIKYIKIKHIKPLFNTGSKFFIIQIATIIQYQMSSFIIARNLGMNEVTDFNIAYKYFGVLTMAITILLLPFWSAATDAYTRQDFMWLRNKIKQYIKCVLLLTITGIIMYVCSGQLYYVWLKERIDISTTLSFWAMLYNIICVSSHPFVTLLNGIGAITIQLYVSLISPLLFIITATLLVQNTSLGASAVLIASIISNFYGFIIAPIQYRQVIIKHKKGIWIK